MTTTLTSQRWYHRKGHDPHNQGQVLNETTGATVCVTYNDEGGAIAAAIAALPDLLTACDWAACSRHHSHCISRRRGENKCDCHVSAARSAIAKAKGE